MICLKAHTKEEYTIRNLALLIIWEVYIKIDVQFPNFKIFLKLSIIDTLWFLLDHFINTKDGISQ